MEMKKLLESLEECGMDMPPAPMDKGNPVSMNVSLNASGKEHVEDLINMMKNAGLDGAKELGPSDMPKQLPMRTDMERLRGIIDGPAEEMEADEVTEFWDDEEDYDSRERRIQSNGNTTNFNIDKSKPKHKFKYDGKEYTIYADEDEIEMFMNGDYSKGWERIGGAKTRPYEPSGDDSAMFKGASTFPLKKKEKGKMKPLMPEPGEPGYPEEDVEEWANSPEGSEADPTYGDMSDMTRDGNDMHKKKKAYAAAQDGDNAMAVEAIKAQLMAALQEKKAKPDYIDIDGDGDTKEPMKKAAKEKGSKPKKGEVPPQFKK